MEGSDPAADFIPSGLALLGIEADEVEIAVMGAFHQLLWEPLQEMLAIDTSELAPERNPDLSKAP
jgi:hypothetical protein